MGREHRIGIEAAVPGGREQECDQVEPGCTELRPVQSQIHISPTTGVSRLLGAGRAPIRDEYPCGRGLVAARAPGHENTIRSCCASSGRVRRQLPAPLGRLAGRGRLVGRRPAVRPAVAGREGGPVRGRRPPSGRRCGRRYRRQRPHGAVGEPGRPELDAGGGARPGRPGQRRGPRRQPGPAVLAVQTPAGPQLRLRRRAR
jgi:hypothetical protein